MRHIYTDGILRPVGNEIATRLPAYVRVRFVTLAVPTLMFSSFLVMVFVLLIDLYSFYLVLLIPLWQLAAILDCSDGYLARERKTTSPGGAALDATADIVGMAFVGMTLYLSLPTLSASLSHYYYASAIEVVASLLLILGITTWTTAPLSTVAKQAALESHQSTAPQTMPALWSLVTWGTLTDWALILLMTSIAIATQSAVLIAVAITWLAISGILMALTRFLRFYSQSS